MRILTLAAVAFALLAEPALAGRTLEEPKAIRDVVRSTPRAQVDKALKDAGMQEKCSDAVLRSHELNGLACRLVVHMALTKGKAPSTPEDVSARVAAAKDVFTATNSIATYEPLAKVPRLEESRFEAHRRACDSLVDAWDVLRGVPRAVSAPLRTSVDEALSQAAFGDKALSDVACECTVRSLDLGQAAGASLEVTTAMQSRLTSRGCFLDQKKIRAERGGPESRFSGRAKTVSLLSTDEAQLMAYGKTRDIGLTRCRDKFLAKGTLADAAGMEKCVCGEVQRWSFPKKKGRPEMKVLLPVYDERLGVRVGVSAPGKVTSCGPLEGPLTH